MLSHPDIGDAALDRQLFTYLEQPIALVPARLNYPQGRELGLPGHIGELGLPGHKGELEYPGHIGELGHTGELGLPGNTGKLGYPGHTEELRLPGNTGELGYPGQKSPTTDQDQFSSWFYEQSYWRLGAARVFEQMRTRLPSQYIRGCSILFRDAPEDPKYGDAAHCGASLHRPVVEPIAEP